MGMRHVNAMSKFLALEARGQYALVTVEPAYDEERRLPQRRYELHTRKGDHVATMTAQSLPGCCGICVLHSFSGTNEGIRDFIDIGFKAAKRAKYGMVLFTLKLGNPILDMVPFLDRVAGDVQEFRAGFMNGKTGNLVTVVMKVTGAPPPKKAKRQAVEGE